MQWQRLPSPILHLTIWGRCAGPFQYVLSYNSQLNRWAASFKHAGAPEPVTPIGVFQKEEQARAACERHYRSHLS